MSIFIPDIINKNAHEIRVIQDTDQIPIKVADEFPEVDLCEITGNGNTISRAGVVAIAPDFDPYNLSPCEEIFPALRRLFVVALLWRGMPPKLIVAMLGEPNLRETLCDAATAVAFGMYGEAYDVFKRAKIPQLDRSIASVYLYFCSVKITYPIKALIFDEKVARALLCSDISTAKVIWQGFWQYLTGLASYKFDPVKFSSDWKADGYLQFLILMHSWASALKCEPAQIQIWLSKKCENLELTYGKFNKPEDVGIAGDLLDI